VVFKSDADVDETQRATDARATAHSTVAAPTTAAAAPTSAAAPTRAAAAPTRAATRVTAPTGAATAPTRAATRVTAPTGARLWTAPPAAWTSAPGGDPGAVGQRRCVGDAGPDSESRQADARGGYGQLCEILDVRHICTPVVYCPEGLGVKSENEIRSEI
jgi:hypothetical protein